MRPPECGDLSGPGEMEPLAVSERITHFMEGIREGVNFSTLIDEVAEIVRSEDGLGPMFFAHDMSGRVILLLAMSTPPDRRLDYLRILHEARAQIATDFVREFWKQSVDWLEGEIRGESGSRIDLIDSLHPIEKEIEFDYSRPGYSIPGLCNRIVLRLVEEVIPHNGTESIVPLLHRFIESPRLWYRIMNTPEASLLPMAMVRYRQSMDPELLFSLMYKLLGSLPPNRRHVFMRAMDYLCIQTARE